MVMPHPWLPVSTAALLLGLLLSACARPVHLREPAAPTAGDRLRWLVPLPDSVKALPGEFLVTGETRIVVEPPDGDTLRVGQYLSQLIGSAGGQAALQVTGPSDQGGNSIHLALRPGQGPAEGYELTIAPDRVTIVAGDPAGLFYGVQTFRQLLPASVEHPAALRRELRATGAHIVDAPRYAWRGAMLDVSRHFLPASDVKRFIDLMALYKLNRLHLHLSDDQGWRVEILSWPNLAIHGGSTQVGGGPGGYYTQEEYRDLVTYADSRFIAIVPEFDMPGHTNAALASYPELNCDDVARPLYTGTEVGFSALCVEREVTYRFVDDVVREVAAMTTGRWFHIGGDEVKTLTAEQYAAFIERVQQIVQAHGKQMIGWDEIAPTNLAPTTVVQHWRPDASRHVDLAQAPSLILSPANRIYLDMKYDERTALGLNWAGYSSVRNAYDWDPDRAVAGVRQEAVLGVEAPLWSETVVHLRDFEYLAFPRLAGVAEIGWTRQASRRWDEYRVRLGAQGPRWSALGINFYRSPDVPWLP